VTAHPAAEWSLEQFHEALAGDDSYRFVLHDRDSIFSGELDQKVVARVCGCCKHRCGRQSQTPYASASAGHCAV